MFGKQVRITSPSGEVGPQGRVRGNAVPFRVFVLSCFRDPSGKFENAKKLMPACRQISKKTHAIQT